MAMSKHNPIDREGLSDEDLVALVLEDPESYLYLVRRYQGRLARYVAGLTGLHPDDIDDVLQETFLSAYRNLRGFDRQRQFSSWLYRIAHNQAVSELRRRNRRAQYELSGLADDLAERLASDEDLAVSLDRRIGSQAVRQSIQRLDEKQRHILVLYYLEEMSYTEISEVLQVPPGTVGSRLSRAKAAFRRQYRRQDRPASKESK